MRAVRGVTGLYIADFRLEFDTLNLTIFISNPL